MAIAAGLSLWAALSFYQAEGSGHPQLQDAYRIEEQTARFAGVRQTVPEDAAMGFITDIPEQQTALYQWLYYGAQYVLAPRLLEPGVNHHWVLGLFTNQSSLSEAGGRYHLRLQYLGNDVALLENEAR